jgi:hypothetical protein
MIVQLFCLCMSCVSFENQDEVNYTASTHIARQDGVDVVLQDEKCKCRKPKQPNNEA